MSSLLSQSNPSTVHKVRVEWHKTPSLGTHRRYTHYTTDSTSSASASKPRETPVAHQYPSIRYAQPLTSSTRWQAPRPLPNNSISLPLEFRRTPICPQPGISGKRIASLVSEDCLHLEIFVPASAADQETSRRPVLIWLHGGFLQWGSVYSANLAEFVRRTGCVVVVPAYRLNAFGFLACEEMGAEREGGVVGNFGFWDQRLAIEWTARNVHVWGGDKDRITLGGYSAGSYSVFHQLMYESKLADGDDRAVIGQVLMMSNGCGLQPKTLSETRGHFERLVAAAGISATLTQAEKLKRLRELPVDMLVAAVEKTPVNSYRAVTDGVWVQPTFMQDIIDGTLGKTLARRNVRVMIGENKDERNYYAEIGPPKSYIGLIQRLTIEFPAVNSARLASLYAPGGQLPKGYKDWQDLFGEVYADCQIHLTGRGFLAGIKPYLKPENIFRYRIYRRVKAADSMTRPELGVTHTSDWFIWFIGSGKQIQDDERPTVDAWVAPVKDYLEYSHVDWGCNGVESLRIITEDAWGISTEKDPLWKHYQYIWKRLFGGKSSKL